MLEPVGESNTGNDSVGNNIHDCQEIGAELDYSLKTDQNIPPSMIDFATVCMSGLTSKIKSAKIALFSQFCCIRDLNIAQSVQVVFLNGALGEVHISAKVI